MYFERFLQAAYAAVVTDNYVGALVGIAAAALWLLLVLMFRRTNSISEVIAVIALALATACVAFAWKGHVVLSGTSPLTASDVDVVMLAVGAALTLASMAHTALAFALSPLTKAAQRANERYNIV